jgi:iron complex outermembrane receptor protein
VDGFRRHCQGRRLADSLDWLITGSITCEPTEWFVANIAVKYTSRRFTDYAEIYAMDSYTIVGAYVDLGGINTNPY